MSVRDMVAESLLGMGTPITIRPDTTSVIQTRGIFSSETVEVSAGNSTSYQPDYSVTIPGADAVKVRKGDVVVVHGRRYKVESMRGDGRIVRRLMLGAGNG